MENILQNAAGTFPISAHNFDNHQNSQAFSSHHLGINSASLFNRYGNQLVSGSSVIRAPGFYGGYRFYGNYFSNQSAISLTGSKSANGSLLGSVNLPNAFGLDLGSNQAVIRADNLQPISIIVGGVLGANGTINGGRVEIITPGKMLTAAQYVAMEQVAVDGQQTLVVSRSGTAISGLITLIAGQVGGLSSVQVPTRVVIDTVGFTSSNPLVVSGTTQVNGSLYALQQSANVSSTLDLGSLSVGGRGLLTDTLSNQSLFSSIFSSSGLTLGVLGNVTNQGTISSAGTLSINSGGQIANISTSATRPATIVAPNVNLYAQSGNVINSGEITASVGNVQFNAPSNQNVNINNAGGTITAAEAINVRDASYSGQSHIVLSGGDWLSKDVNLNAGNGIATANIGNVTGAINANAAEAHVTASTADLIIGNTNLSGDPSYFNTAGAVTIAGNLNFSGQDLAIVAKTNILTAAGAGTINTNSATGGGGNITMISGANFTSSGPAAGNNDTTTTLTVTGGSATGGYIDLKGTVSGSNVAITSLNSSSTGGGGKGGNITLAAYGGTGASAGTVTLPTTVTVNSGGNGAGVNGNVSIIAGATTGTSINVGNITASGGTGGGGNITLATQTPTISGAANMTILNGSITNGTSYIGGATQGAAISAGTLTAPASTVSVTAGTTATLTGALTDNGVGTNGAGGTVNLSSGSYSSWQPDNLRNKCEWCRYG